MQRILKASAVMGLSSVATVGLSAVRYKFIALHLGAQGIGTLGLLVTLLTFGVTLFTLGLGNSGVREVAAGEAKGEAQSGRSRAAVTASAWALGLLGGGVGTVLALLAPSTLSLSLTTLERSVLGLTLFASTLSAGQIALLNGLGQIKQIARANIYGSVIGTVATLVTVFSVPALGVAAALAVAPLVTAGFTSWYTRAQVRELRTYLGAGTLWPTVRPMLVAGAAFSATVLISSLTQLLIRRVIEVRLGVLDLGYFQAAWTVASVYLGFVLNAMAVEYYPRISAFAENHQVLDQHVRRQIRFALVVGAPVIILLYSLAPSVIELMYSDTFHAAIPVLRLQLLGDVLKIPGWAFGFLLLSIHQKGWYLVLETLWNVLLYGLSLVLLPRFGINAVGIGYLGAYVVYYIVISALAFFIVGFRFDFRAGMYIALVIAAMLLLSSLPNYALGTAFNGVLVAGVAFVVGMGLFGWTRQSVGLMTAGGRLAQLRGRK
ncbi:oligosaccharide flippase family protein [Deinococcus sonorensis]|uniref:Oligosaccharide flippase family protein n=2 Tax=Deinococcus sonorensis TaxID=309891 RepID=A0AAU7UE16_9DEIO